MQRLSEKVNHISKSVIEYDYTTILDIIENELKEVISASFRELHGFNDVLGVLTSARNSLRELLPVAEPLSVLDSVVALIKTAESRGYTLEETESVAQAAVSSVSTYKSISLQTLALSLSYAVRPGSSILTIGYTRLLKEVLIRLRGRIAVIYTTFDRPLLTGRRMAVELLSEGLNAYSLPDSFIASLVDKSDYVIITTPGVNVNGILALDPGAYPAIALAKAFEKQVILVLTGLSVTDEDITINADRRVNIELSEKGEKIPLSLAPFEYSTISDIDLVITEAGTISEVTREKLNGLAMQARNALIELAFKALG